MEVGGLIHPKLAVLAGRESPVEHCDSIPQECAWNNNEDLKAFYGRGICWRPKWVRLHWRTAEGAALPNAGLRPGASGLNQPQSISMG